MSPPVQELLNPYKLVRLYCLPLRGTERPVVVPYESPIAPSP